MYRYGGKPVMGKIVRQKIGKQEYIYFQYFKNGKLHRIYCGNANDIRSLPKARDLMRQYLEEKLKELTKTQTQLIEQIEEIKHELEMLGLEAKISTKK